MCTNFVLIKRDGTATLADRLMVDQDEFLFNPDVAPGAKISIIIERDGTRQVKTAIWWLYLQQMETGFKPNRNYFSVNSSHAKLKKRLEYKTSRCIIPATAFVESQDGKRPHLLIPRDGSALAFGGLWKEWIDEETGEIIYSASIITLAGHPALENIHRKSTPLWLPDEAFDQWLDPNITDTSNFDDLLAPALRTDLTATPIDKTRSKQPIAESFTVSAE
ncbi:MAG: SOS response-associated peptidase family protein [Pseudomonadales bacterium]